MTERLIVQRITVTGPARQYSVSFRAGVNVIAGPISTGKTTLFRLIDYAFGSSRRPAYPEIAKCSDVYVELEVGGESLTIRRALHGTAPKCTLYGGTSDLVFSGRVPGEEVSARQSLEQRSVSSELMTRLGLGNVQVKVAPKQEASDLSTFSLRDLLTLIRVEQTRISSEKAFFEDQFAKAIKWKAGFELINGLFDANAASLASALSDAEVEARGIRQYLHGAVRFLDQSAVAPSDVLTAQLAEIEVEGKTLAERAQNARSAVAIALGPDRPLLDKRDKIEAGVRQSSARIAELTLTLDNLGRLRVQYEHEKMQLEFMLEAGRSISGLQVTMCPACYQPIHREVEQVQCRVCRQELPEASQSELDIDKRVSGLRRRIKDLESYTGELTTARSDLEHQASAQQEALEEVFAALRRVEESANMPKARHQVELAEARASLDSRRRRVLEHLELRRTARGENSNLLAVEERIERLRGEIHKREEHRPSPDALLGAFTEKFASILRGIRFPDPRNPRIDRSTYMPIVREQPYAALSSSGAIALVVASWHLALLQVALQENTLHPRILMLDSPLSHVGHDATDAQFKDQQIVEAFYTVLTQMHEASGSQFQLLVCDNRPPASARDLIQVEFTGDPTVGRFGFIDDETGGGR